MYDHLLTSDIVYSFSLKNYDRIEYNIERHCAILLKENI